MSYPISNSELSISSTGALVIKPVADSTAAVNIQNAAGSSTILTIDSTDGTVGIGTAPSASYYLNVGGNTNIGGTLYGGFAFFSSAVETPSVESQTQLAFNALVNATNGFTFQNASGNPVVTIDTSNNRVGIGVSYSPSYALDVNGTGGSVAINSPGDIQGYNLIANNNVLVENHGSVTLTGTSGAISLQAPATVTSGYTLRFPPAPPTVAGQFAYSDTSGNESWTTGVTTDGTNLSLSTAGSITQTTASPGTNGSVTGGNIVMETGSIPMGGTFSNNQAITAGSLTITTGPTTGSVSGYVGGKSTTTTGGSITLTTGDTSSSSQPNTIVPGLLTITTGNSSTSGSVNGGGILLTTGNVGSGTAPGITLTTGSSLATQVNGGSITLTSGNQGFPGNGGNITLTSGNASSLFAGVTGGSITLTTGTGGVGTTGGSITLTAGSNTNGGVDKGGNITLTSNTPAHGGNIFLTGSGSGYGQVGIGTSIPNASASLDIESTTRGFLMPQMTTTQKNAISSPATGLEVYDTTLNNFSYWNGSAWTPVGAVTSVSGTANQITASPTTGAVVLSIPSTFIAPGSIQATTTLSGSSLTLTNPLTVANGGTGLGTLTAHAVLLGEGTSNVAFAGPGTTNFALVSNGTSADPTFQAIVNSLTGTTHQVNVSASTGSITLSTPQNIDTTSSPTFQQLTLGSTSLGGFVLNDTEGTPKTVTITAPTTITTTYSLKMPTAQGLANTTLLNDGSGNLSFAKALMANGVNAMTASLNANLNQINNVSSLTTGPSGTIVLYDSTTHSVTLEAPTTISTSYTLNMPTAQGTTNSLLTNDGSGNLSWSTTAGVNSYVEYVVGTASGSYTGSTTVFALPFTYTTNGASLQVFYNGQQLEFNDDYTETSSSSITTSSALVTGTKIWFRTISGSNIVGPVSLYRENYVVGTALNNYTGSTTVFNLVHSYNVGGNVLVVTVDGVVQTPGSSNDYLETNSTTVTFNNALVNGQSVSFMWANSIPTGGTVNTGTAGQMSYYAGSVAAVSPSAAITTDGTHITSLAYKTNTYTANHTITTSEIVVLCNANSAGFTVTLPDATVAVNNVFFIKKTDSSSNLVTIATTSSQTIDGSTTVTLSTPYSSREVVSDGSNWQIL